MKSNIWLHTWVAYGVLAISLTMTLLAWYYVRENTQRNHTQQLQQAMHQLQDTIHQQSDRYIDTLLATRGFFDANTTVSRQQWKTFAHSIDFRNHYPGTKGIGFAPRVEFDEVELHMAQIRQDVADDYHIHPQGRREVYFPIVYIEPFDDTNRRAFGYDMSTDPQRRQAMTRAGDTGQPAVTGTVNLDQELPVILPGIVVYVPVYKAGMPLQTWQERRTALRGFVFSRYQTTDMIRGILQEGRADIQSLDFQIYDGSVPKPENLLYDSNPTTRGASLPAPVLTTAVNFSGRDWSIWAAPKIVDPSPATSLATLVLLGGILVSWLLFGLSYVQIRARHQSEQNAQELRRTKEQAEAANRSKDQFLAVLSHELRNPLAPMLSMVNALQNQPLDIQETREALSVISRNVELEARLIDDLLDITRISKGKMPLDLEPVDGHTVMRHAIEIAQSEINAKELRLIIDLTAQEHFVSADPVRLQQVFWNLLKNAVKFTPENGTITVRTRNKACEKPAAEPIGSVGHHTSLVLSITDTGIGIEPQTLPRIFDAFEQLDRTITRRFGGLGLGMAISKALIDAHHGTIAVTSEGKNHGATVTITMPTISATTPRPALHQVGIAPMQAANPTESSNGALRILLVDDQPDALRGMSLLLEKYGFAVSSAANVAQAINLANQNPFDLLISDIGLPDVSGFELIRMLRAHPRHAHIHAIALTGLGMEQDLVNTHKAGFDQHLTKPVDINRLLAAINQLRSNQKT